MRSEDWHSILNWRLLAGSHTFPGPDGGTCINEAAVVAAGFEYREIVSVSDCPKCFSRPLSAFLMGLNDAMSDHRRSLLTPFVVRLAGSVDGAMIERRRAELLVAQAMTRLAPMAIDIAAPELDALPLRRASRAHAAGHALVSIGAANTRPNDGLEAILRASHRLVDALDRLEQDLDTPEVVCENAGDATAVIGERIDRDEFWSATVSIVDQAFDRGAQASPIETEVIERRMAHAKRAFAVSGAE